MAKKYKYSYSLKLTPARFLEIVEKEVAEVKGVKHQGDELKGRVSGLGIEAEYLVVEMDTGISVNISLSKPFLFPEKLVVDRLDSVFSDHKLA